MGKAGQGKKRQLEPPDNAAAPATVPVKQALSKKPRLTDVASQSQAAQPTAKAAQRKQHTDPGASNTLVSSSAPAQAEVGRLHAPKPSGTQQANGKVKGQGLNGQAALKLTGPAATPGPSTAGGTPAREGKKKNKKKKSGSGSAASQAKHRRAAGVAKAAASASGAAFPASAAGATAALAAPVHGGAVAVMVAAAGGAALVSAGSNWASLKTKIGATGEGAKKRAESDKAAGAKPHSMGSNTGVTPLVAVDCEMVGVGPEGVRSALARVAVVNQEGNVLLDTFVKTKEKVVDYRTKFSGVRHSDLQGPGAIELEEAQAKVAVLLKGRVLVGHALENDLSALLLDHPRKDIRDTARFPPLMRSPAPGRKLKPRALRHLAAEELGLDIQTGEHSPVDDARAALYLYLRHKKEWEASIKSGSLGRSKLVLRAARQAAAGAAIAAVAAITTSSAAREGGEGWGSRVVSSVGVEMTVAGAGAMAGREEKARGGAGVSLSSLKGVLTPGQLRAFRTGRGMGEAFAKKGAAQDTASTAGFLKPAGVHKPVEVNKPSGAPRTAGAKGSMRLGDDEVQELVQAATAAGRAVVGGRGGAARSMAQALARDARDDPMADL